MTGVELLELVESSLAQSLSFVTLTVPGATRGLRKRVLPGRPSLYGVAVGEHLARRAADNEERVETIVAVKCDDIRRWLLAHLQSIESDALRAAESGRHERAAELFNQYAGLRDRLAPASGGTQGRI